MSDHASTAIQHNDPRAVTERALSTLVHASRVSPLLRDSVATVEDELRRVWDAVDLLARRAVSLDGRYIVLCDDGSIITTDEDELMDDDNVLVDRGEDW